MNFKYLIQLLDETPPESLPTDEISILRRSMHDHREVREALAEQVRIEQALATRLAPELPTAAEFVALLQQRKLARRRQRRRIRVAAFVFSLVVLSTFATAGVYFYRQWNAEINNVASSGDAEQQTPPGGKSPKQATTEPKVTPKVGTRDDADRPTVPMEGTDDGNGADSNKNDEETKEPPDSSLPPFEPAWRQLDDATARGDLVWMGKLDDWVRAIRGTLSKRENEKLVNLNGLYELDPPTADGMVVRLRISELARLKINFESDGGGAQIDWHDNWQLRGISIREHGDDDTFRGFPNGIDARFLRANIIENIDPVIDFNWGAAGPKVAGATIPADSFAVRWTGQIVVPRDGKYSFITRSDDGCDLTIDRKSVIRDWTDHAESERRADVQLKAGSHDIAVEYYESSGNAVMRLEWEGPDIPRQVVPSTVLRPDIDGHKQAEGLFARYCYGPQKERSITQVRVVAGGDGGRWNVFRQGAIDFRYQQGHIVVARGDIVLLRIPMSDPPNSMLIDTQCNMRLVERLRLKPLPAIDDSPPALAENTKPADLDWKVEPMPDQAALDQMEDGGVRLARDTKTSGPVQATTPIDAKAGMIVTLKLHTTTPLTGLFFDNASDAHRQFLYVVPLGPNRVICQNPFDPGEAQRQAQAGFHVGDEFWCRATYGFDNVEIEISADGRNWQTFHQRPYNPQQIRNHPAQVGLCAADREGLRIISLKELRIERFDALEQLAQPKLVDRVPIIKKDLNGESLSLDDQYKFALAAEPDGVGQRQWRLACHARFLHRSAPSEWVMKLAIEMLWTAIDADVSQERIMAALVELPQRCMLWREESRPHTWPRLLELYDALAEREWMAGRRDQLAAMLDTWYHQDFGPGVREYTVPLSIAPPKLLRLSWYHAWGRRDFEAVQQSSMKFEHLVRSGNGHLAAGDEDSYRVKLAAWMREQSAEWLPGVPVAGTVNEEKKNHQRRSGPWAAHPLVDDSERATATTLSEFLSALDSEEYAHACRIMTRDEVPNGIVPLQENGRLAKHSHVLMREAIDTNPRLAETMQRDFASLGNLRLRQKIEQNDYDSLDSLATQFHGTPAGYEADKLLADRDLSLGNFFAAAARYQTLLASARPEDRNSLVARLRLALAMTGEASDEPLTGPVELGDQTIAVDQFEATLADLVRSRGAQAASDTQRAGEPLAPLPRSMKITPLFNVEVLGSGKYRFARRWIAATFHGKYFIAHQHSSLHVYDLAARRMLWQKHNTGRDRTFWAGPPARPLILDNKIIVPLFNKKQRLLTCLDIENGKVIWQQELDDEIAGEPVMIDRWLYVISLRYDHGSYATLVLRRISPETGESLLAQPLARLREGEAIYRVGRPARAGDSILIRTGGALICCDLVGRTRWIRKLTFVPPSVDPPLFDNHGIADLIVHENTVVVAAAGSPHLCCLDVRTGRTIWEYLNPYLRRLLGQMDQRLIVITDGSIEALDIQSGERLWRTATTADYGAILEAQNGLISTLTLDRIRRIDDPSQLARRIQWLSSEDGEVEKSFDLPAEPMETFTAAAAFTDGNAIIALTNIEGGPGRVVLFEPN